jgi:hypothetical protein
MFASEKVRKQKHLASTPSYYTLSIYPYPFFLLKLREKRFNQGIRFEANIKKKDPVDTLCSIPFFKDVDPPVDNLT